MWSCTLSTGIKKFNYKIGKLTEYFKFDNVEPVLQDLRRMSNKALTSVELELLEGNTHKAMSVTI